MNSLPKFRLDWQLQPDFSAIARNPRWTMRVNFPEWDKQRYANLPDDSTYLNTPGYALIPVMARSNAIEPPRPCGPGFQSNAYPISKYRL